MNHINPSPNNQPKTIPSPARGKIDTSQDAADSLPNKWRTKTHLKIVQLVADSDSGLTADELEVITGMRACSLTARVNELLKATVLERRDEKRRTRSGRFAYVYFVVPVASEPVGGTTHE